MQRIVALVGIEVRSQHVVVIIDVGIRFLRLDLRLTLVDPRQRIGIHVAADAGIDGIAEDLAVLQRRRILAGQDGKLPVIRLTLGKAHAGGGNAPEGLVERDRVFPRCDRLCEGRTIRLGERIGRDDATRGQFHLAHVDHADRPSRELGVAERDQLEITARFADIPAGGRDGDRGMRCGSAKKEARRLHDPVPHRKLP